MEEIEYQGKSGKIKVKLRDTADRSVWFEIFKIKEYRVADSIISTAKNPIVDVGAHAGFFTLYARDLNPEVQIYCLEPEPKNLLALAKNIKENKVKAITVVKSALAAKTGERDLLISSDSHNHKMVEVYKKGVSTVSVSTISLKDFFKKHHLEKISLLKMDIEGGEYEVFNSLEKECWEKIDVIIMEYHNGPGKDYHDLEQVIRENGFGVRIFPSKFDKNMGFLFAQNKRVKNIL